MTFPRRFTAQHFVLLAGASVVVLPALSMLVPQARPPAPAAQIVPPAPGAIPAPGVVQAAPQKAAHGLDVATVVRNVLALPMTLGATPAAAMALPAPSAAGAPPVVTPVALTTPKPLPQKPALPRHVVQIPVNQPEPAPLALAPGEIDLRPAISEAPMAPTMPMADSAPVFSPPPPDSGGPVDLRQALTLPDAAPPLAAAPTVALPPTLASDESGMIDLRSAVLSDTTAWARQPVDATLRLSSQGAAPGWAGGYAPPASINLVAALILPARH